MLNKKIICIALITFILSVSVVCDWEDRKGAPPVVYLSQILENPESWLDVPVRIPLRYSGPRDIFTAYFSAFDRDRHYNFSAWDIHTHIWQKKGFVNDYPFFYVEKDAKEFRAFLRLRKFDTIAVMGKIVSIFRGKPYFKIVWVCKQSGYLNVHNLTLLNRASNAYQNRSFDDAISFYSQVEKTNPPTDIVAMIHKVKANIFLYHKNNYSAAMSELNQGLELANQDPQMLEMYTQCDYYLKHGGNPPQPVMINFEPQDYFPEEKDELTGTEIVQPSGYTTVGRQNNSSTQDTTNYSQYSEPANTNSTSNSTSNPTSAEEEFTENDEEGASNREEEFSYEEESYGEDFYAEEDFSEDDGDVEDRE